MRLRVSWLAALFVATFVGLSIRADGFNSWARVQGCGAVKDEVLLELESQAKVSVIISLEAAASSSVDYSIADMQQTTANQQAAVLTKLSDSDFSLAYQPATVPALVGFVTGTGADKLDCHPYVLAVGLNTEGSVSLAESVPLIRADVVQAQGIDGTDVDIAVFDTGIDTDHPDLLDNIIGEACFTDVAPGVPCPDDPAHSNYSPGHPAEDTKHGHGTHVSGIITSKGVVAPVGVAPNANIFAYKVLHDFGSFLEAWVLAGLDDVITNHSGEFEFINMSFALQSLLESPEACDNYNLAITWVIGALRNGGTLTIAGSGNHADKSLIAWPACISTVLSVGAVYDADIGSRRWPSDPTRPLLCSDATTAPDKVACFSDSADWLDLLAPGSEILSTWPFGYGVAYLSGTSMASPHAVGVAALLKQARPDLTPDQIVWMLKATGKWVKDEFNDSDPNTFRWTPRVDARVALVTDFAADYDEDGCSNEEEFGLDPALSGLRNPLDPWDFYDTNGDKKVDLPNDILGVINRWGTYPGGPPNPDTGLYYDAAYDRGLVIGPNHWNRDGPDGTIDLPNDITGVTLQWQHDCTAAP